MRKKILIIAHSYGMQFLESCNQYTQLFDKEKYEVTAAYLIGSDDETIHQKTEAENILFLNLPSRALRGLKLRALWQLYKLCHGEKFHLVICHRYKPTYLMLLVAQFCRINALLFVMHAFGTMNSIPRRLIVAALLKKNMVFAAVSNAARDDMRKDMWRVPKDRIITFYNIMDHALFEPQIFSREDARQRLNISEDAFVFGHIGRFVKEKNQKSLIEAFAAIKPHCASAKLLMIGDGKLEHELQRQSKALAVDNDVIFTGFIMDGFRLMKAFDAFVLTSTEEAFGRVSLEAMTARVPLIATRISGIPEVVGASGFLVEPSNTEKLADCMLEVYKLSMNELVGCGEKGYQRMLKNFSIQAFGKTFWQSPLAALLQKD
jgi:glycosyltransferase involved in cell wall biosynthesis